ncbi:MAG: carboxy terminal-processing peptidase [Nonlabens sp.]|nr:carboxy terminal-processing peptidase [Nonlabens sp.]
MNFLKNNLTLGIVTLLIATASCSFTNKVDPGDKEKEELLIYVISNVLKRNHFSPADLTDQFSEDVFKNYINDLDPAKRYFLQKDYEDFAAYKFLIDDQIQDSKITLFKLSYERLLERQKESRAIFDEIIEVPFDYNKNEIINTDYENMPYAKNKAALKDHWRKLLKLSAIGSYYEKVKEQEELPEAERKSLVEIEKEVRMEVKKSIIENFENSKDIKRLDYFSVYVNAITSHFDPHTNYLAPQTKDRFDQSMSGKLEGIGARLQKNMDNIKVMELISGGPAWRSKKLEVGDVIQKVAQEKDSVATSIMGMSISDAVELIKGPKGTKVRLTLKKVDGRLEVITLERDVVLIEETFAKSMMVKDNSVNYGLINLPTFYFDMENKNGRAAGDDIAIELKRLKDLGAEGLILDLRGNGGGSLREVIEMVGHFIPQGPVVQVALKNNRTQVLEDEDGGKTIWDGPLVIMVDELSASASEILAAALQDYDRAVILGSKQTFGKGTVQNFEDLNSFVRNSEHGDLGAVKLTTQKFYRVNGSSTQLEGVKSDVVTPDRYSYIEIGERDEDFPLPYDEIAPATYQKFTGYANLREVIKTSNARIAQNANFKLIDENAQWLSKQRKEYDIPLNYDAYAARIDKLEQETDRFDALDNYKSKLTFEVLPYEKELMMKDETLKQKREEWQKSLTTDLYVEEAVMVLKDLRMNTIKNNKLSSKN